MPIEPPFTQLPDGSLKPSGTFNTLGEIPNPSYFTEISDSALALKAMYYESGVRLPDCDLAVYLEDAISLPAPPWPRATFHMENGAGVIKVPFNLLRGVRSLTIAKACACLNGFPKRAEYLYRLTDGPLGGISPKNSVAKNTYWELELCTALRLSGIVAVLQDSPDIVATVDGQRIGIECKKIYSEKHIRNVISKAARQMDGSFDHGVIAMNIDELWPNEVFANAPRAQLIEQVRQMTHQFVYRHSKAFEDFLHNGRLMGAIIGNGGLVVVDGLVHPVRHLHFWEPGGLAPEKRRLMQLMRASIQGAAMPPPEGPAS